MSVLSDFEIAMRCHGERPMIEPFVTYKDKVPGTISYGLSSHGYDLRSNGKFWLFHTRPAYDAPVIDPKAFDHDLVEEIEVEPGQPFVLPPQGFCLTSSLEYFRMPSNVRGVCWGKSTYARAGLMCHVTPLEAGWEGNLTIELSNQAPLPLKIYPSEGLCQIEFSLVFGAVIKSYAEKGGKYQGQTDITAPKGS